MNNWTPLKNDDEYYTFEKDVENFLKNVSIPKDKIIWCPFDNDNSAFVKVLKRGGYKVINSHIDNGKDFYKYEPEHYDLIMSNPPFKNKYLLMERLIKLKKPFALIFGLQCFSSCKFTSLLKQLDNLQLVLCCKRIKFHKGIENDKLPSPSFQSLWICNDLLDSKIKIID